MTRIGVVGATGALGQEIIAVLDRVQWRPDTLLAYARASTAITHVEYGDDRIPVDVTDELDPEAEDLDLVFTALPRDVAGRVIGRLEHAGIPVVDPSGARPDDTLVVPWVNPEALAGDALVWQIPLAPATLVASVLGPLARAGVRGAASAQVLLPASVSGRGAIEELSQQVLALFNSSPPPRRVFPQGLAFDVLPGWGEPTDDGRTDLEQLAAEQVARLLAPLDPGDVELTAVQVPVFSGISAIVTVDVTKRVPVDLVERILADGGVVLPEVPNPTEWPRPRKVEGKPFAHVARVRTTADGALQLFCAMDNLRTTAMAAAATAQALFKRRDGEGS